MPHRHDAYLDLVNERLTRIASNESGHIEDAATICADAIGDGRIAWVFGAGHSAVMALEAYPRIGGIFGFVPMVELSLLYFSNVVGSGGLDQAIFLERAEGYAESILLSHDPQPGDAMVIFSSSGVEVLPRQMAKGARDRGLKVIAVTSTEYSAEAKRRRGLHATLADGADVVIDNSVPPGDAILALEGLDNLVGPSSTMLNIAIMNSIAVDTAGILLDRGISPSVFHSPHLETSGTDAYREALRRFRRLVARAGPEDGR